jgi:hypothetical protein
MARPGLCAERQVHSLSVPASATGWIACDGRGEADMDAVEGLDKVEVEATLCAPAAWLRRSA